MEQLPSPRSATPVPTPYDAAAQVIAAFPPARPRARIDGWTPERQRLFCETLADCGLVRDAATAVGMSPQSAYALKRRPEGKGFALAWAAALLLARARLVDLAIERAVDGNIDQYVKDGEVVGERRKQDVRHLLAAITKIENGQTGDLVIAAVADDFDEFLDCMVAEAGTTLEHASPDAPPAKGKRKPKRAPSPLQLFFEERDCGPGLEGHEFEAVLAQLARAQALPEPLPGQRPLAKARAKSRKSSNGADDIGWDWLEDPCGLGDF